MTSGSPVSTAEYLEDVRRLADDLPRNGQKPKIAGLSPADVGLSPMRE